MMPSVAIAKKMLRRPRKGGSERSIKKAKKWLRRAKGEGRKYAA